MLSANTLKHSINVQRSYYAGYFIFCLYSLVILVLLLTTGVSWLTFPLFLCVLFVAVYGADKAYKQQYFLKLSDSGQVELRVNGDLLKGKIAATSFYNSFFISLQIVRHSNDFVTPVGVKRFSAVIYRDAVSEDDYRLLARILQFGREAC